MNEKLLEHIEEVVEAVYRLEISKIDSAFVKMIDALAPFMDAHPEIVWNDFLLDVETSYKNADYVRFADLLEYSLKPCVEEEMTAAEK